MSFARRWIDRENFEAACVCDVMRRGQKDIVCGGYWYEGPDYTVRHKICDVRDEGGYRYDFCDYPLDINGDGYPDIVTGDWFSGGVFWRENPGRAGAEWTTRRIGRTSNVETIRFFDIDGCGTVEIFPNTPGSAQCFYKLRGPGEFTRHTIGNAPSGHGMGFADVNGDGRTDILLAGGWLEQPENLYLDEWTFHPEYDLGSASVPILGIDVNGDGLTDLIAGSAHGYGLFWHEQRIEPNGRRVWIRHAIEENASQYHDMRLADVDGNGEIALVTGARHNAHNGNDPGERNPIGVYVFRGVRGGAFEREVADFGAAGEASGVGICFDLADLTGNGKLDIVAPGKEGLCVFYNQ